MLRHVFNIKKLDSNTNAVNITAVIGELTDGVNTASIYKQWQTLSIQGNGTSWDII